MGVLGRRNPGRLFFRATDVEWAKLSAQNHLWHLEGRSTRLLPTSNAWNDYCFSRHDENLATVVGPNCPQSRRFGCEVSVENSTLSEFCVFSILPVWYRRHPPPNLPCPRLCHRQREQNGVLSRSMEPTRRDRTMTFTTFVMFDMFNALCCRSADKIVPQMDMFANKAFIYSAGGSLVGQVRASARGGAHSRAFL